MLLCPVCQKNLTDDMNRYICENGHAFDKAKEGYVNLLAGRHKQGSLIGDNRDMAKARRRFLEKGYYDFLAEELVRLLFSFHKDNGTILDISCGEGYYTDFLRRKTQADVLGFDISKEMIRMAAKKYREVLFFVANIAAIPLQSGSIDAAVQICAPFHEKEFCRILKKDGVLLSVVPGRRHLWGLKEILYENPYENQPDNSDYPSLRLKETISIGKTAVIEGRETIADLFAMTPYSYKTSEQDKQKLLSLDSLTTQLSFDIRIFKKEDTP